MVNSILENTYKFFAHQKNVKFKMFSLLIKTRVILDTENWLLKWPKIELILCQQKIGNQNDAKLWVFTLFSGKVVGGLMKCNIGKKTLSCHHLI